MKELETQYKKFWGLYFKSNRTEFIYWTKLCSAINQKNVAPEEITIQKQ